MSNGILKVQGDRVVDSNGKAVVLRGAGLGGWMNMENVRIPRTTGSHFQFIDYHSSLQATLVKRVNIVHRC